MGVIRHVHLIHLLGVCCFEVLKGCGLSWQSINMGIPLGEVSDLLGLSFGANKSPGACTVCVTFHVQRFIVSISVI